MATPFEQKTAFSPSAVTTTDSTTSTTTTTEKSQFNPATKESDTASTFEQAVDFNPSYYQKKDSSGVNGLYYTHDAPFVSSTEQQKQVAIKEYKDILKPLVDPKTNVWIAEYIKNKGVTPDISDVITEETKNIESTVADTTQRQARSELEAQQKTFITSNLDRDLQLWIRDYQTKNVTTGDVQKYPDVKELIDKYYTSRGYKKVSIQDEIEQSNFVNNPSAVTAYYNVISSEVPSGRTFGPHPEATVHPAGWTSQLGYKYVKAGVPDEYGLTSQTGSSVLSASDGAVASKVSTVYGGRFAGYVAPIKDKISYSFEDVDKAERQAAVYNAPVSGYDSTKENRTYRDLLLASLGGDKSATAAIKGMGLDDPQILNKRILVGDTVKTVGEAKPSELESPKIDLSKFKNVDMSNPNAVYLAIYGKSAPYVGSASADELFGGAKGSFSSVVNAINTARSEQGGVSKAGTSNSLKSANKYELQSTGLRDSKGNLIYTPGSAYKGEVYGETVVNGIKNLWDVTVDRPGFTATSQLGDTETQNRMRNTGLAPEVVLETQRQTAIELAKIATDSGNRAKAAEYMRQSKYYANERDKALQSNVELASAYHHGQIGVSGTVNPYEYVADLSVYALKGTRGKDKYFSPVGTTSDVESILGLSGGVGTQDFGWTLAKNSKAKDVNFLPAVKSIAAAKSSGDMGAYRTLGSFGGNLTNNNPKKTNPIIKRHITRPRSYDRVISSLLKPVLTKKVMVSESSKSIKKPSIKKSESRSWIDIAFGTQLSPKNQSKSVTKKSKPNLKLSKSYEPIWSDILFRKSEFVGDKMKNTKNKQKQV